MLITVARPVRKRLLLAAIAFAFAAPAADTSSAHASRITLGAVVVENDFELDVPYALDAGQPQIAKLGVAVKSAGASDFEFVDYYDPQPSGTLHVWWRDFHAGEVRVRVTAVAQDWAVLDTAEVATTVVERWTVIGSLTPSFGTVEVGTLERKRARFEGWGDYGLVRLRMRNLRLNGDADFKIVSEDCTSRLVGLDGCEVEIEFAPTVVGERKTRIEFEANAPAGGYVVTGSGKITPSEPLLPATATPLPTPTATPTPTKPEPPELGFGSAPGRTSTKLSGLQLEHLKPGTTITVKCAKGCPAKALTKRGVSGTVSLARFATRRLRVGTTIRVTITAPGAKPIQMTLKIRANREPSVSTR
jgi:hypothetical protein